MTSLYFRLLIEDDATDLMYRWADVTALTIEECDEMSIQTLEKELTHNELSDSTVIGSLTWKNLKDLAMEDDYEEQ